MAKFPILTKVKDIRSFVGLVAYYRRFIPAMAAKAKPLTDLMKGDPRQKMNWTSECQKAFDDLKTELTSSRVMAYPDMTRPFYLETDASMSGLGVIVSQKDTNYKNHLRPILYGSRVLKDAETRYCASELEALAIVWALKRYNAILWNQALYVITDHEALKKLMAVKEPATPKLARYVELMSTYGITNDRILYRPGLKNQAPDALSRYALPLDPKEMGMDLENDSTVHRIRTLDPISEEGDLPLEPVKSTDDSCNFAMPWREAKLFSSSTETAMA